MIGIFVSNSDLRHIILNTDPHWGRCPKCGWLAAFPSKAGFPTGVPGEFSTKCGKCGGDTIVTPVDRRRPTEAEIYEIIKFVHSPHLKRE